MSLTIRPAQDGDAPGIAAIWTPVIRDTTAIFNTGARDAPFVRANIADRRATGTEFFVAEEAGRILGFATYGQFRSGNGYVHAYEHSVMIAPEANGRGVGRALMAAVEGHARGQGGHTMVAAISGENAAAQAFHAQLGYAEVGRLPESGRKFDRWLDLVLMMKTL